MDRIELKQINEFVYQLKQQDFYFAAFYLINGKR